MWFLFVFIMDNIVYVIVVVLFMLFDLRRLFNGFFFLLVMFISVLEMFLVGIVLIYSIC